MNALLLVASFGFGALSALYGRTPAKWSISGFVAAFVFGALLSPAVDPPAVADAVNGLAALGLGLSIVLGYRPAEPGGYALAILLGLGLGLASGSAPLGHLGHAAIPGLLVFVIAALAVGFAVADHLCAQAQAWALPARRVIGLCIIVVVPWLILSDVDDVLPTDPGASGAIAYTGHEQRDDPQEILEALIRAVYFAFNAEREGAVYDRLALAVDGPMLTDLYLQQRRSQLFSQTEGGQVTVESVELLHAQPAAAEADDPGLGFTATWQASGLVSHARHEHRRTNRYEAVISIAPVEGNWKITGLELLDEQRTDTDSEHRGSGH
jgi:hydrogenase/urease accessory protein HupE